MTLHKIPVQPDWFDQFEYATLLRDYSYLPKDVIHAETIVNFGCWSSPEPFVLLWIFDASEITVVEINERFLEEFKERTKHLRITNPPCLQGRTIKPIVADMSHPVPGLSENYFDLAFCENTLYNLKFDQPSYEGVQSAINEMARVVRPGGYVVANEWKMGVEFDMGEEGSFHIPVPLNEPTDINDLFVKSGLVRLSSDNSNPFLYIYQKGE